MRVLVVEDEMRMATLIRRGLVQEGFAADLAGTGEDALWMAAAHDYDAIVLHDAAIGLAEYGKPGNYFARQIGRWTRQYQASETEKIEAMDKLIEWLPANIPPEDETTIVHGDFRIDNMIFHPTEQRVLAVLDWELSTLGHPLADFSYHCMSWHVPPGTFRGLYGHDIAALGIPTEAEYVARYCQRTGRNPIDPDHWDFYLAYNMFRGAAIVQGVMKRAMDGNAANQHAIQVGKTARPTAEKGWQRVEQLLARR